MSAHLTLYNKSQCSVNMFFFEVRAEVRGIAIPTGLSLCNPFVRFVTAKLLTAVVTG